VWALTAEANGERRPQNVQFPCSNSESLDESASEMGKTGVAFSDFQDTFAG